MTIEYIEPLARGWTRMKRALFTPFDLRKWFVVGFTAFLSGLTDFHGGSGGSWRSGDHFDWARAMNLPQEVSAWFVHHPTWLVMIGVASIIILLIAVVLVWVSSRGKFMFLDNVVKNRALVVKPWTEFANEGNSLFLWNLLFGFILILILVIYLTECYTALHSMFLVSEEPIRLLRPAIWMFVGLSGILIGAGFVGLMLRSFVVPIMYRERTKVLDAWSRLLELASQYPIQLFVYSLVVFVIMLFVVIGIVVIGFLTCCIGFVVLAIPYLGDVILLPLSYTMRAFSLEFLEQFGPEYTIFPLVSAEQPGVGGQNVQGK